MACQPGRKQFFCALSATTCFAPDFLESVYQKGRTSADYPSNPVEANIRLLRIFSIMTLIGTTVPTINLFDERYKVSKEVLSCSVANCPCPRPINGYLAIEETINEQYPTLFSDLLTKGCPHV
jgi:hypothetical protein